MSWAQSPLGAWEAEATTKDGIELRVVSIITQTHQVITWYEKESGAFIKALGGSWKLSDDRLSLTVEFNSETAEEVGTTKEFSILPTTDGYQVFPLGLTFNQIDNGAPGKLMGSWQMTARKQGDAIVNRPLNQARRTLKLLSGTRFQWIAFNSESKEFLGTGGGTYITNDETYTEQIEFFSRDVTRVGDHLTFTFNVIDSDWHHSGLSSKGNPIYEIWSKD